MSETQRVLELIAKEKNMNPMLIEDAMNKIGFHESWDSEERTGNIANRIQMGGGPGRGAFQYEIGYSYIDPNTGTKKWRINKEAETDQPNSAIVARQRALNYYEKVLGEDPPEWLVGLPENFNPAELPLDKQQLLFLTDHRMRKGSDFKKLESMDIDQWWGMFHQTENDPDKRRKFRTHAGLYEAELKGGPGFEDIPVPLQEPGRLDFELPPVQQRPKPVVPPTVEPQPVQEEAVSMEELQGQATGFESEFDKIDSIEKALNSLNRL